LNERLQDVAMNFGCKGVKSLAACAIALTFVLAGCASAPTTSGDASTRRKSDLYEGAPQTIFATELPVESAEEARARAAAALDDRNTDLALYMYIRAVELDASDSDSLYNIGTIHGRRGNTALATKAYARAVYVNPEHARALEELGLAYLDARDMAQAEAMLDRAVTADRGLWRAHNALGVIDDTRGNYARATSHYDEALKLRPGTASILNNRGYSRYLVQAWDAAEADFLAAVAADPEYDRAWHNLGLVYARQHKYAIAVRTLSRVMEAHVASNDIGYIAMLDRDYTAAATLFAEAIRLSPRYYKTAEDNTVELRRRRAEVAVAMDR
jgi:Tfp pilus assembly protein PilF